MIETSDIVIFFLLEAPSTRHINMRTQTFLHEDTQTIHEDTRNARWGHTHFFWNYLVDRHIMMWTQKFIQTQHKCRTHVRLDVQVLMIETSDIVIFFLLEAPSTRHINMRTQTFLHEDTHNARWGHTQLTMGTHALFQELPSRQTYYYDEDTSIYSNTT